MGSFHYRGERPWRGAAFRPGPGLVGSDLYGNNSNDTSGIAVQLFDPSLFSGSPISLQNFGPAVGDADGLTHGGGFIFVPDRDEGLRRIAVPSAASSISVAGTSISGTGSPVVFRPSAGHVFVGFGSTVPRRSREQSASMSTTRPVHSFTRSQLSPKPRR